MALIQPFRALRFTNKAGELQNLTCPPYDIISQPHYEQLLKQDPHNAIRLELPTGAAPYTQAKQTLDAWLEQEILKADTAPALYLYEEQFRVNGEIRTNRGIFCLVKVEDYEAGTILRHEETLLEPKEDRFSLLKETQCNFSPVYALYEDKSHSIQDRIERLCSDSPRYEFKAEECEHRLWVVNDLMAIQSFQEDFEEKRLWIADGHHRYATALNYRRYCREIEGDVAQLAPDYMFFFLADAQNPELTILPLHRLVRGIPDFDSAELLEHCKQNFDVLQLENPEQIQTIMEEQYTQGKKAFACYTGGAFWWLLQLKDNQPPKDFQASTNETYRNLDVTLLHGLILEPLLGITAENMAKQQALTYERSYETAVQAVQSGEQQCAFFVNPARVKEVQAIAESGLCMPQKSTYFYPKPITGLVMRPLYPTTPKTY